MENLIFSDCLQSRRIISNNRLSMTLHYTLNENRLFLATACKVSQTNIIHGLGIRFLFGNCLKSVKINPDGHCLDRLDCKKMDSWDLGDFIMPFQFSLDISWHISWLLQHSLRTVLLLFYASYYCSCCERGPSVWGDEDNCLLWFWLSHFPGPQIERVWLPRLLLSSW